MDNNKQAGSTDSKCLPNLDDQISHTDMQWIHATFSQPRHTTATDASSVETMEESKITNTVTSYEQVKNLMTKVLDSNSLLLVNENSDKEKKTSCLDRDECFVIDDEGETKKEDSEEDIEDDIDEEDEEDDEDEDDDEDEEEEEDEDDSCESDDDISDSLKSCSNLYLFSPNFLNHALNDDSVKNVERPDANEESANDKVDKKFVNRPNSYYIEKKKERRNKQNMLRIDCKPKKERSSNWLTEQMYSGANPRKLLTRILPYSRPELISPRCSDSFIWKIIANACSEPPRRSRLSSVSTFNDVIDLLEKSTNIIVLTGAGVSVSCGIPDFRSNDGIYSRLAKDFPDLPDPQAMFDINYFSRDPRPFYKFAREIYPGQFKPSPCHRFIKLLEDKNKLLRNYTQNIDTLEQVAGIKNVIECHGSFSTATCTKCKYKCGADSIRSDIFEQRIPVCPRCQPDAEHSVYASQPVSEEALCSLVANGIMKPDIVFFGEGLSDEFHTVMASDKNECDLLIVMGSSLKVRPVALIPSSIPAHVPQILINREKLLHLDFDVKLLGDGDVIINQICQRLGGDFKDICFNDDVLRESTDLMPMINAAEVEIEPKEEQTDCIRCKQLVKLHYSQPPLAFRRRYLLMDPSKGDEEEVKKSPEELKCPKCTYWAACASYRLQQQRRQNKKISERLLNGTYYCHQQSASYVFPGAQVSACSDTETDDEELFAEISPLNIETAEEEAASSHQSRQQPLSPIMSSSIEAEMVSDITNMKHQTTIPATGNDVNASLQKRSSPELIDAARAANREEHTNSTSNSVDSCIIATKQQDGLSHPPPYKRPRDSLEKVNAAIELEQNAPGAAPGWHNATNNAL